MNETLQCNIAPNAIPKMATIKSTAKLFRLSEYFVRQLALSGKIISVRAGNKILINVDRFAEYLNTSREGAEVQETQSENGIKPIPARL